MKSKTYLFLGIVFAIVGATRLIVDFLDERSNSTQDWIIAWFWWIAGIAYILKSIGMGKKEKEEQTPKIQP